MSETTTTFEVGRTYRTRGGKVAGLVVGMSDAHEVYPMHVEFSDGYRDWLTIEGRVASNSGITSRDLLPGPIASEGQGEATKAPASPAGRLSGEQFPSDDRLETLVSIFVDKNPYNTPAEIGLEIYAALRELKERRAGDEHGWLVWSNEHSSWWKANGNGYTSSVERAGRYSLEEARKICRESEDSGMWFNRRTPDELIVPSPELTAALAQLTGGKT